MPSLIDLRRRIRSVKNTQQITKAMKVVSAAKLRRAQDRVLAARPYAQIIQRMLANVAQAAAELHADEEVALLATRPEKRIQLLVITADRGLAGAFNSNVIRLALKFIQEHSDAEVQLELIGRKGRDFFRKRHASSHRRILHAFPERRRVMRTLWRSLDKVIDRFKKAEIDAVYLAVNNFKTMMASQLVVSRILPVELPEKREQIDYIYEQPPGAVAGVLCCRVTLRRKFTGPCWNRSAAEHAARMTAMESASSNAADVIDR